MAAKFLTTMKEFPPNQSPGSFNLSKIAEQLRNSGGNLARWRRGPSTHLVDDPLYRM
jgi:hypothetical protein